MDPPSTGTVTGVRRAKLTIRSYAAHEKQSSLRYLKIIFLEADISPAQTKIIRRIIGNGHGRRLSSGGPVPCCPCQLIFLSR
jgi:hypothetical protein